MHDCTGYMSKCWIHCFNSSQDVLNRWTYPLVPNNNLTEKLSDKYAHSRHNIYLHHDVTLARWANNLTNFSLILKLLVLPCVLRRNIDYDWLFTGAVFWTRTSLLVPTALWEATPEYRTPLLAEMLKLVNFRNRGYASLGGWADLGHIQIFLSFLDQHSLQCWSLALTAVITVIIQCNNGTNRSYYRNGMYKSRWM